MENVETVRALVALGKKAAQGQWTYLDKNVKIGGHADPDPTSQAIVSEKEFVEGLSRIIHTGVFGKRRIANRKFMAAAANARPAFAGLLSEVERLRYRNAELAKTLRDLIRGVDIFNEREGKRLNYRIEGPLWDVARAVLEA